MQWRRLGVESCVGYMLLVIERQGSKTPVWGKASWNTFASFFWVATMDNNGQTLDMMGYYGYN